MALAVAIACAVVTNDMARQAGPAGARARMSIVERILFVALVAAAMSAGLRSSSGWPSSYGSRLRMTLKKSAKSREVDLHD